MEVSIEQIAEKVIEAVGYNHIDPKSLSSETILMGGDLDLDSIDVLEVVAVIEESFGVKIKNAEEGMEHFKSLGSIKSFVEGN